MEKFEDAKNNEKRLQLLIDKLPARISYVNAKEIFVLVNNEYENIFKKDKKAIIGSSLKDVLGEVNYHKIKPYVQKVMEGDEVHFEIPILSPGGETLWNESKRSPGFYRPLQKKLAFKF